MGVASQPAESPASRIGISVKQTVFVSFFALIALAAGTGAAVYTVDGLLSGSASHEWPTVTGEITESRVRRRNSRATRAAIEYEYRVGSTWHYGHRIGYFHGIMGPGNPLADVARYPVGSRVTVYYDPENTDRSVLEPGLWWIGGCVSVALTLAIPLIDFLIARSLWRKITGLEAGLARSTDRIRCGQCGRRGYGHRAGCRRPRRAVLRPRRHRACALCHAADRCVRDAVRPLR